MAGLTYGGLAPHERADLDRQWVEGGVNVCVVCGVIVNDQTPSAFYLHHDESCNGVLNEPEWRKEN